MKRLEINELGLIRTSRQRASSSCLLELATWQFIDLSSVNVQPSVADSVNTP